MAIDFDRFLSWAENKFSDVRTKGNEIKVNSIFYEELHGEKDSKCKLWCNPLGGKKSLDNGVFHCWRTGRKGSLVSLVMMMDNCAYDEALAILGIEDTSLAELEKKLEEFFNNKDQPQEEQTLEEKVDGLQLPPYTFFIEELSPSNFHRVTAEVYLFNRSLPIDGLMVCCSGKYRDRIIIPYYDREGKLIYYNARYIGAKRNLSKYMGPPDGTSILKGDVIFMPRWAKHGEKVFYTEGEFDAISIAKSGLNSGALGGKNISESQVIMMKPYQPVICLDNDQAGKDALPIVGDALLKKGINQIGYVMPPPSDVCKLDWNKMLEKYGPRILRAYLLNNEQAYDPDFSLLYKTSQI